MCITNALHANGRVYVFTVRVCNDDGNGDDNYNARPCKTVCADDKLLSVATDHRIMSDRLLYRKINDNGQRNDCGRDRLV